MSILTFIRNAIAGGGLIIIFIGIVSYYLSFKHFTYKSIDETLTDQMLHLEELVEQNDTLVFIKNFVLQPSRVEQSKVPQWDVKPKPYFKDTLLYEERTGTFGAYRQLYFPISYKNNNYIININQPSLAVADLSSAAITSICIFIVLFLLFISYISSILKKKIWSPLSKNAKALNEYNLQENSQIELAKFDLKEFDQIFDNVGKMVKKINQDYLTTRHFIEDVSHEMQTPVSIIVSKLDLIEQVDMYESEEKRVKLMNTLRRAVLRMSKLNKSLLLISKINNDQFPARGNINIKTLIDSYIYDYEELLEVSNLNLTSNLVDCEIFLNNEIGEYLISNLMSNAIRHNITNGNIHITLENCVLTIVNTCLTVKMNKEDDLFSRMVTKSQSKESSGLGLNIVKSICDKNHFTTNYELHDDSFKISINFRPTL